ncbi:hypothetical protein [Hallerella succinigenes]|uniref:Uncharacterized protein n=1 Tax=Hallerella succinigenes TaxID=1896222 RepID=A0A2M9A8G8_9BACT|nr:hypothetical protein [Hallerella succinigenes]PJJ42015.1 hypothetical protein BGX16_2029 [Hallerella succinigenes]
MSSFREFKDFKSDWKPKKRIPVVRTLIVLALIYAVYASGAAQKAYRFIEDQRKITVEEPAYADLPWREGCAKTQGTSFDSKKGSLGQCGWIVKSEKEVSELPDIPFLHYAASVPGMQYPLQVHWIADSSDFWNPKVLILRSKKTTTSFYHLMLADSSFAWVRADGCRYPGACPRNPLQGGALPIEADFDFGGREELLLKDLFMGIGEAPVYPILPGYVISVSKDSLGYKLYLDHGGNLFSRVSGLSQIAADIEAGKRLEQDDALGRLAPNDSAVLFLEVLRNGRFVRWDDFYKKTHVADAADVKLFLSEIEF